MKKFDKSLFVKRSEEDENSDHEKEPEENDSEKNRDGILTQLENNIFTKHN